ncbi:HAD family hydrolase [Halomicroarcula sp. GCM10025709]|uniref:HAD family hydrolase n=1 Tax=Haloarcula TaxID=2237 RepID=UPI0024C44DD3|nr:HAD family hydrolase [Halomicroarcula sp. YJ-61-S]
MSYESVIFDNDGVLLTLTSMDTHQAGTRRAFERVGVVDPEPDHLEAMRIGVTPDRLDAVCRHYDLDPDRFWTARDGAISEAQRAAIRAGEKRPYGDIRALDRLDGPLGVVSSNQQATVDFAFDHFDLDRHFETVRARPPTVESIHRKKPRPYYIEQALADLGVTDALYVGDSESDIEAARRAGIDSAFVRRPHTVDTDLSVTPTYDVDGLETVVDLAD